jgi:hypothetical protein
MHFFGISVIACSPLFHACMFMTNRSSWNLGETEKPTETAITKQNYSLVFSVNFQDNTTKTSWRTGDGNNKLEWRLVQSHADWIYF